MANVVKVWLEIIEVQDRVDVSVNGGPNTHVGAQFHHGTQNQVINLELNEGKNTVEVTATNAGGGAVLNMVMYWLHGNVKKSLQSYRYDYKHVNGQFFSETDEIFVKNGQVSLGDEETTLTVPAKRDDGKAHDIEAHWGNPSYWYRAGDKLTFSATGNVTLHNGEKTVDAEGLDTGAKYPSLLFPDAWPGSLVGRLATKNPYSGKITAIKTFKIGKDGTFEADVGGNLYFAVNDNFTSYSDNAGEFSLTIKVEHKQNNGTTT